MWEERVLEAKRLKAMSSKALARWGNRFLTAAWNRWHEQVVQARRVLKASKFWLNRCLARAWLRWLEHHSQVKRLIKVTFRVVMRWALSTLSRAFSTWETMLMDSKRLRSSASKVVGRWRNRVLSQGWQSWYEEHSILIKLQDLKARVLKRWKNRSKSKAFVKWWAEVCRNRIAKRTVANFLRRTMCKTWRSWVDNVDFFGKDQPCSCNDGVCPKCERKFKLWDDDWEQAMNDHAQMESDLLTRDEGGFVGLQVSEFAPHQVKQVDDLVDKHFVRHDSPGYSNPRIKIGDHILLVDGMEAEDVDLETLHRMLKGPLHTTVTLSLARAETGDEYSVVALRHGFRTFGEQQQASGDSGAAPPRPLADWPQDGLYGSQKGASYTTSELYNSQRSAATASDLYASHRSSASGRISPPLAPLINSDTGGVPRALSYVRQSRSPRAFTPPTDEPNGVVASSKAPTMRIA